jgi:two-component system chemotaxis response regulator CheY
VSANAPIRPIVPPTPLRILVVDDSKFMRGLVGKTLAAAGHEVVGQAEDGAQAVERYAELRPDVLTLDITMPNVNGLKALEAIISLDPEARVVMCSALGQERKMLEAMRLGAKSFIVKPYLDGLPGAIAEALR